MVNLRRKIASRNLALGLRGGAIGQLKTANERFENDRQQYRREGYNYQQFDKRERSSSTSAIRWSVG